MSVVRHTPASSSGPTASAASRSFAPRRASPTVVRERRAEFDFGEDLGHAPGRHGFSLQHDHGDRAAWEAYNENAAHARAGAYLKSITRPELAARVDWIYDGPGSQRGAVRQLTLCRWAEPAGERAVAGAGRGRTAP